MPDHYSGYQPPKIKAEQKPSQRQIDWLNEHVSVISYRHGGGAGGQNKNKVSSAAELRWRIADADPEIFSSDEKELLTRHFSKSRKRWNESSGEVLIQGSEHRDYEANRRAVLKRLIDGIQEALNPNPDRRPTRPTRSSVKKRLEDKKRIGREKSFRRQKDFE